MTEAEWRACDTPHKMLSPLRPWKRRARKMRLYVCASYRRPERQNHLTQPCLALLDVAERHADGLVDDKTLKAAKQAVSRMTSRDRRVHGADGPPLWGQAILNALRFEHLPGWEGTRPRDVKLDYLSEEVRRNREDMRRQGFNVITEEQAIEVQREWEAFMKDHVAFLQDIFGNPFQPAALDPVYRTSPVLALARQMYDTRDFAPMPILTDALQDAGCSDESPLVGHCRGPGPHVRGCWVVDLILGKA